MPAKQEIHRVSGFILYDTPEDNAILRYLLDCKRRGVSYTGLFKAHLYRLATGQDGSQGQLADIDAKLDAIQSTLARGVAVGGSELETAVDDTADLLTSLRGMTT